ncbi:MAG TPA: hypothetical protein VJI66_02635 [Candidatus Paceibacterota bacterium]
MKFIKYLKNNTLIIYGFILAIATIALVILYPYLVVTDETNNTPSTTIDNIAESYTDDYYDSPSIIDGMPDFDSIILLESDDLIPLYEDFLNDLQEICPFYKPNAITYRDCLVSRLKDREKLIKKIYEDMVINVKIINDEMVSADNADEITEPRQDFINNLTILYQSWKSYRNALCGTELSKTWGGSNQSGYINVCKLYQSEIFMIRLLDYRYEWVGSFIQYQIEKNLTPKTEKFKDLMRPESIL